MHVSKDVTYRVSRAPCCSGGVSRLRLCGNDYTAKKYLNRVAGFQTFLARSRAVFHPGFQ